MFTDEQCYSHTQTATTNNIFKEKRTKLAKKISPLMKYVISYLW